ncbi:hypothetical protein XH80_04600 [Bradyrhizobium sp. CCBAU 45384]|nr:hypothetical protein [Bradyrhizobium sp. CCBAU 45384]
MTFSPEDRSYIRLLQLGPFNKRVRGGWRFGTKRISDAVVDRLVARGVASREGDRVELTGSEAAE